MTFQKHTLLLYLLASVIGQVGISKEMSHEITWGPSESGLQAGIALENTKQLYRQGESIGFALSIRNVSDHSIPLEYTERPLKAWTPEIYDQTMNALPVMPPILPRGGRILSPTLKPGEILMIDRGTFTIQPLGWEGMIDKTVVFADARNDFERLVELSTSDTREQAKALLQLGRICAKLNDLVQAKQHLKNALEIDRKIDVFTTDERSEITRIVQRSEMQAVKK